MDVMVLKVEHSLLSELRTQWLDLVNRETPAAAEISAIRWRMSRLLLTHLAKEDSHVYPRLKADHRLDVSEMAVRYEQEMGDLAGRWQAFIIDWPAPRMTADWAGFRAATILILDALAARIMCEERDLYPCFETAQSSYRAAS